MAKNLSGLESANGRMVMLEDIICPKGNLVENLLDESAEGSNKAQKSKPKECIRCKSPKILGVEIMGGYDGILFWECDICENTILRFKEELTEKYLQLAKGYWTNPQDWGYVSPSKFN